MKAPSAFGKATDANPCPVCPICEGTMEVVYDRFNQRVVVCLDCHSGLTIPATALDIVRLKREKKFVR